MYWRRQQEAAVASQATRDAASRLPALATAAGGARTLASVLRLRAADPRLGHCLCALHVLAARHLGVLLTDTSEQALPLLEQARRGARAVRVWPLDRLRFEDVREQHRRLREQHGPQIVSPLELLDFDPELRPAVASAFGRHVIVPDDRTGSDVVDRSGWPCCTFDGTLHERGRLSGGYRGEAVSDFALMRDAQLAARTEAAAADEAAASGALLTALQRAARRVASSTQATDAATARVAQLREACDAQRVGLHRAEEGAAELAHRTDCAAARLRSAREEASLLEAAADADRAFQQCVQLREGVARAATQAVDAFTSRLASAEADEPGSSLGAMREFEKAELQRLVTEYDTECARAREALHSHEAAAAAVKRASKAARKEASTAQLALDQALEQRRLASSQLSAADAAAAAAAAQAQALAETAPRDESVVPMEDSDAASGDERASMTSGGEDAEQEDASSTELRAQLEASALRAVANRRERQLLERKFGTVAVLREKLQGSAAARVGLLQELKRKEHVASKSIESLTAGIEMTRARIAEANASAFAAVREKLIKSFEQLVPAMELDVRCDDPEALDERGTSFRIRTRGGGEWRSGLHELSGGQRTLLKISALLAVAEHRPSMVVLMDEVDAALDEHNTQRIGQILKELARSTQVIAISHRREFQQLADHTVRLYKDGDHTVCA